MNCKSCMYFENNLYHQHGECRRHAPAISSRAEIYSHEGHKPEWPTVEFGDWCGDYVERHEWTICRLPDQENDHD